MIAGTVVIEDSVLTFRVLPDAITGEIDNNLVSYTVCDSLTGEQETRVVSAPAFMLALSLALSFEGEFPAHQSNAYEKAVSVQPLNPKLRFIP